MNSVLIPRTVLIEMDRRDREKIYQALTQLADTEALTRQDRIDEAQTVLIMEETVEEGVRYFTDNDELLGALTAIAKDGYAGYLKHKTLITNLIEG